jgi:adenosylcobinamide-GDP ribazoletransferase
MHADQSFPGVIVGLYGSIWFAVASGLFSPLAAAVVYTISTVYLTGAFHEDGLADTFDAFGGGWTRYDVLRIMRDSRIGTYGALGLFLVVVLKLVSIADLYTYWLTFASASANESTHPFALLVDALDLDVKYGISKNALFQLPIWVRVAGAFVSAHVLGRWSCTLLIWKYPYVENASAAGKQFDMTITFTRLVCTTLSAIAFTAVALLSVPHYWTTMVVMWFVATMLTLHMGVRINIIIGGVIGDCLGATNQLVELATYLVLSVNWITVFEYVTAQYFVFKTFLKGNFA